MILDYDRKEGPMDITKQSLIDYREIDATEPWLLNIRMNQLLDLAVHAHELSHVLGIAHEYQRLGQDKHVRYAC
ncbi:hypothetical protein CC78DRAFT_613920, partial [Lojkania enalia]